MKNALLPFASGPVAARTSARLLLVGLVLATSFSKAADEPYDELPIDLPAGEFLSKSQLTGDGYSIAERISNDGLQNTYTLQTEFGIFSVTGTDELLALLQEIRATIALQELQKSDEFKDAAMASVTGLVDAGKSLVESPGETAKAAAKGVGRWMRNVGGAISTDDPHQDNAVETAIGYDAVKRRYAIELGVDPYTDFEPFQDNLSEVAKVAAAGSMVTSFAIKRGTAGSLAGVAVNATSLAKMKAVLEDNPPVGLARINLQKLLDMGIAEYQAEALLKNYNYTPMEMTLMCEALERMGEMDGREIFVAFATSAPDTEVAHFIRHYAEMLAHYVVHVEPGDIVDISGAAWMLSDSKSLVGVFPLDYVAWTPSLSQSLTDASGKKEVLGANDKKILLKGQFSPRAQAALKKRGWKLSEKVRYSAAEN
jgi:hypothetical protein